MSAISEEIDRELQGLDPSTTQRILRLLRETVALAKSSQLLSAPRPSLAERIKDHPAIGTWPRHLNADEHIEALRREWDA